MRWSTIDALSADEQDVDYSHAASKDLWGRICHDALACMTMTHTMTVSESVQRAGESGTRASSIGKGGGGGGAEEKGCGQTIEQLPSQPHDPFWHAEVHTHLGERGRDRQCELADRVSN